MASKLGKVVTYQELLLLKLLDPQSRGFVRSRDIYLLTPLALDIWLPNMGR